MRFTAINLPTGQVGRRAAGGGSRSTTFRLKTRFFRRSGFFLALRWRYGGVTVALFFVTQNVTNRNAKSGIRKFF